MLNSGDATLRGLFSLRPAPQLLQDITPEAVFHFRPHHIMVTGHTGPQSFGILWRFDRLPRTITLGLQQSRVSRMKRGRRQWRIFLQLENPFFQIRKDRLHPLPPTRVDLAVRLIRHPRLRQQEEQQNECETLRSPGSFAWLQATWR